MPSPEQIYSGSVRVLSVAFVAIGIALIAATLAAGGSVASVGILMGAGFIAVGAARLYIASRARD